MTNPTEHQEQVAVVRWLQAHGVDHFAVPNGGKRGVVAASRLKAEGVVAGVADLIITDPCRTAAVVALEMKTRDGGRVSQAQKDWLARHGSKPGWVCYVAHGAEDAIAFLRGCGYGG